MPRSPWRSRSASPAPPWPVYGNNCALGYALGKDVPTDCSVNAEIEGKTYCFGNAEAKTIFMKDVKGNLAKAEGYASKK